MSKGSADGALCGRDCCFPSACAGHLSKFRYFVTFGVCMCHMYVGEGIKPGLLLGLAKYL